MDLFLSHVKPVLKKYENCFKMNEREFLCWQWYWIMAMASTMCFSFISAQIPKLMICQKLPWEPFTGILFLYCYHTIPQSQQAKTTITPKLIGSHCACSPSRARFTCCSHIKCLKMDSQSFYLYETYIFSAYKVVYQALNYSLWPLIQSFTHNR